ncbi:MAG: hypothetical protein K2K21_13770 [Lachnospiraceae bacterium]|nr:hypothetical protein [Lachnospiraceae bacterium]
MKKKYALVVVTVLAMGMTACSLEPKEGVAAPEAAVEQKAVGEENPETETVIAGITETEVIETETPETNAAMDNGKEVSSTEEIMAGDPLVAMVDRYEDNIIVLRDLDDEDIIYYFSTEDAQVIEGDTPIVAGNIVEITYKGVQGDEEHPGTAVKVVAESMMYKKEE